MAVVRSNRAMNIIILASLLAVLPLFCNIGLRSPSDFKIVSTKFSDAVDAQKRPVEPSTSFTPHTDRIYCVIRIRGLLSPRLIVRWHHGGEEIAVHYIEARPDQPTVIWLDSPPEQPFNTGTYSIKIYDARQEKLLKASQFRVEERQTESGQ